MAITVDSRMYETYGRDWEFIKSQDEHKVATLVDDGDGGEALLSGIHWVNRIGYFLLETPWTEEFAIDWDYCEDMCSSPSLFYSSNGR
jgi:hypothetical protein